MLSQRDRAEEKVFSKLNGDVAAVRHDSESLA